MGRSMVDEAINKENHGNTMPVVSIIIPTLNAGKDLNRLLSGLMRQNYPIHEILIVDSASDDETSEICKSYDKVSFFPIPRSEYDHGRTRDIALRRSCGDVIVFLTQDAIPADSSFLDCLIAPLQDERVAVSIGRQLPKWDATKTEALVRKFNYPEVSSIRSAQDIPRLGIKAFFSSDSCAAYRRDAYLQLGGFDYPLRSNEDMLYAAKALQNGYYIAYAADAKVYHSHNFSLREQYTRNYLQGYEMERHRMLLCNVPINTEGILLVKTVSKALLREKRIKDLFSFGLDCTARWLGNRNGKRAYHKEVRGDV